MQDECNACGCGTRLCYRLGHCCETCDHRALPADELAALLSARDDIDRLRAETTA
jgi:hypothetical protein